MGWYSGNRYDAFLLWNRLHGPYSLFYYMLLVCNIVIPQVLWIPKLRTSPVWLCSSFPASFWSACGWSASSSWWSACIATS